MATNSNQLVNGACIAAGAALAIADLPFVGAAIAAVGEIGDLEAVDEILKFAQSEDWLVRQRLAEALGYLPTPKTEPALRYLEKDAQFQVAESARISLTRLYNRKGSQSK